MADNTTKPIEQIKAGDFVLSRDEKTHEIKAQRVRRLTVHQVKGSLVLHFSNGEKIETTEEHPFYVAGQGFLPAGRLALDLNCIMRDQAHAKIVQVEPQWDKSHLVYNIVVEGFHTYFVGKSGIWVHNPMEKDF